jgi:hypothetical protein
MNSITSMTYLQNFCNEYLVPNNDLFVSIAVALEILDNYSIRTSSCNPKILAVEGFTKKLWLSFKKKHILINHHHARVMPTT